jgi:hypothetical protein
MLRDILFLLFTLSCLWLVLKGLSKFQVPTGKFLIFVALWIIVLLLLSLTGFLSDFSSFPPRMALVLAVPVIVLIWYTFSHRSNDLITKMPPAWIVKMQGFRVVVELFLWWAYLDHVMPVQMTFEGRNFDILVGLSAPMMAFWGLKQGKIPPRWVLVWNVAGILILLNIVIIAILSMPTPKQYFFNEPANTIVATFPWVLLPGILVALAFALHLISIKQMLKLRKA